MTEVFLPLFVSFLISVLAAPKQIKYLKKVKMQNTERKELESHQVKTGTPSMGGIIFVPSFLITSVIFGYKQAILAPVIILTAGCAVIGYIDDKIKAVRRKSDGLKAWQKMSLLIIVTAIFEFYMVRISGIGLDMIVPFVDHKVSIGIFAIPLMVFAVLGTTNGSNLTDGVDGLCTTVTIVISFFFVMAGVKLGNPDVSVCSAMVGALMGFLVFNCYPAKVFMGDTGSLALGGFVVAMAYVLQMPLFLLPVAIIYIAEALSVMIQVTYFKLTHGKRIFRMAPIHHHFELGGWSEVKVVTVFTIVTFISCVFAYCAIRV